MKYIVFLGDGMADMPIEEFGGLTPLQKANKPNMDYLARRGICGTVKTVPDGMTPGSDVANLAVMGYDPLKVYSGRAPLEALSIGVDMSDTDIAVRCNLVTLSDEGDYPDKTMVDYSAGEISTEEAHELIDTINSELGDEINAFYGGVSYRNCLIIHGGEVAALTAPHDISGKVIGDYLPNNTKLRELMERSYKVLAEHPINVERIKNGKNPANSIWLWGAGSKPLLPNFKELYGLNAAVISAVDLLKGIAIAGGMKVIDVEGTTGRLDTNWDGKAQACVKAIKDGYDYVYLHMEAADECGHQGDANGKVKAIECIDNVVEKVMYELQDLEEGLTVMVTPDHPTPVALRTHTSDSVPFIIYNTLNEKDSGAQKYSESECGECGLNLSRGEELMTLLLSNRNGAISDNEIEKVTDTDATVVVTEETALESNCEDGNVSNIQSGIEDTSAIQVDNNLINDDGLIVDSGDNDLQNEEASTIDIEDNLSESVSDDMDNLNSVEELDDDNGEFILADDSELPKVVMSNDGAIIDENDIEVFTDSVKTDDNTTNNESGANLDKKTKKVKKEKSIKVKDGGKNKKEKSPLTKEEKKKRIIIYSVAAVLLLTIIICSIVIPIVIINKDKIFVGKAEDFQNVNDGKYYVLTDDIVVSGDLTLPRPYSIDLAGHTLTVSGTLKYESNSDESQNIVLGIKNKKDTFAEGVIDVGALIIDSAGGLEVNAVINSDTMSLNAKNIKFITGVKVNKELTISGNEVVFEDNLIFGENGKAVLNGVRTMKLMKEARADFVLHASKLLTTQETVINSAMLDGDSELRVFGSVLGDIVGGRLVVMTKTGSAAGISGTKTLWLHDDSNVNVIDANSISKIEQIKELTAPPTLNVSNENGKIMLSIKTVAHAKRYSVTIGDSNFVVNANNVDGIEPVIVKTDITDYVSTGIGNIRISVVAMGSESDDIDLIVPSNPTILNYTHEIKLSTPQNAVITNEEGKYILSFDGVNFANKYKIEINGKVIETSDTTYDITSELTKPGSYSVYIQAVNTENAAIKNSEKALTGIDVYKAFDAPGIQQINNDDGTVSINITAPLAKMIKICINNGEQVIQMQFRDTVELGKLPVGTNIRVTLIGYGYYTSNFADITIS